MKIPRKSIFTNLHWYHWLVVFASILLTLIAWYISKSQTEQKLKLSFEFQSQQLLRLVSERMSRYEDALRGGVATIEAQNYNVDVNTWRTFSDALNIVESYPGINGIGVIYHVPGKGLASYLSEERRLRPNYKIHPEHNQNEYWPITYVEPVASNRKAIGLDMAFETNRFTAAKKARDTNNTQITGPIVLVQDAKKTPGFLQYVPFYKSKDIDTLEKKQQHFVGHVYAPFIMYKLIQGTLSQQNRQVIFRVQDGEDILYDELSLENENFDVSPLYSQNVTIDMYGRSWSFTINTAKSFRENADTNQPNYILVAGVIIDSLLIFLFSVLARQHSRAKSLAEKMTEELKVSEQYFRQIIEAAPCGILIVNKEGLIQKLNPYALKLVGYKEEELLNQPIECLVPNETRGDHQNYRDSFNQDPQQRRMGLGRDVSCLTKNGRLFPAEIGLAQFADKDGRKVLVTLMDMSEQINTTNDLKRSNKDLANFAYVASHDLKAPLRGITQLSSWIEKEVGATASDEVQRYFKLLNSRTLRLETLLDDLLLYSRVGKKQGDFKELHLDEWVSTIFEFLSPPPGFSLNYTGSVFKLTTLNMPLEIIMRNLMGNAIKHHDKTEGVITVNCVEQDDFFYFTVADDGPGINPAHYDKVFKIFQTLRPRDQLEGSGMGMAIVKKILHTYRSDIHIEANEARGTCFCFVWPKERQLNELITREASDEL